MVAKVTQIVEGREKVWDRIALFELLADEEQVQ